jgi:hypothetical protein
MKKYFNTCFQNEAPLFEHTLPIWSTYDIDKFIFFDDHSTDGGSDVIYRILGKNRAVVLNKPDLEYDDSMCIARQMMLDFSRAENAEFVFCLDADELLSSNLKTQINEILTFSLKKQIAIYLYWFNQINYSLKETRCDGYYSRCFHPFIVPTKYSGNFSTTSKEHHSFWRTPPIHFPNPVADQNYGIVHLQMINTNYYVHKQLWYKHYEHIKYGFSEDYINSRYDNNINYLNFEYFETPSEVISDIKFDISIFDKLIDHKGYREYIRKNFNYKLVTFGQSYIDKSL